MKSYFISSIFFMLFSFSGVAQENIQNAFVAHFSQEREHISVHLNKEVFTPSETLWFTTYASISSRDALINESLNLQVGLYDTSGSLLKTAIFYMENGTAAGSLLLDVPSGSYYIKVQTNWMNNFIDCRPFVKKIEVVAYGVDAQYEKSLDHITVNDIRGGVSPTKMTINTLAPRDIILAFETPSAVVTAEGVKKYFLVFHNNENLRIARVTIDAEMVVSKIPKSHLFEGVNTILMVDSDGNHLQEQMIYHLDEFVNTSPLSVRLSTADRDSVVLQLSSSRSVSSLKNVSISIVPMETKAIDGLLSIKTQNAFRNVHLESGQAFFLPKDRKSLASLNELIKTATNTFDWRVLLEDVQPIRAIRERGFDITGRIASWKNGKGQISFYQRPTGQFVSTSVSNTGAFVFANTYVEHLEKLNFSVSKNGKTIDNPKITFEIHPVFRKDTLVFQKKEKSSSVVDSTRVVVTEPLLTEATDIRLDAVVLKGRSKKEVIFTKNPQLAKNAFYEAKKIGIEETKKYPILSSYIRTLGFRTGIDPKTGDLLIQARNPIDPPPFIFMDGFRQFGGIRDEALNGIDEVYYEANGIAESVGGTIYIYRKRGAFVGSDSNAVISLSTSVGFEKKRPYFNANRSHKFDIFSKKYGAVFWNGAVDFDVDGTASISFPRYGLKGVLVCIQGVDQWDNFFETNAIINFD